MAGPLTGIKVIDFSHARAGPQATMTLGDMGANVIKIERPGGEMGRLWGPIYEGERIDFLSVNRNKRGIVLDFADQADLGARARPDCRCGRARAEPAPRCDGLLRPRPGHPVRAP